MNNPLEVVLAADIPLGDPIVHARNGLGVLVAFDAELNQITVKHPKLDSPTVYALSVKGILRLLDGRWVELAPHNGSFALHWADAAHPTYALVADLPAQARGVWPLAQLAGEQSQSVIEQLVADMPTRPLTVAAQAPLGCWYNPQWCIDTTERYLLTDYHGGMELTVALRVALIANAQGQSTLSVMGMQPLRQIGCQMTCELQQIAITEDAAEGVAQLHWSDAHVFYAHLCCLDEHAPYVHAGGRYDWLLSGVALSVRPADMGGIKLNKPTWLDAVNAMLAEPLRLDDEGELTVTTDELRYLLPSEDFSPQHEFRGEIMQVAPCSFEPLVHAVYGANGWVLEMAVLPHPGSEQPMRIRMVCPAKTLALDFQPEVGQVLTGQVWLQAWLWGAAMLQPIVAKKPVVTRRKKFVRKTPKT